jgi:hypothetical protein
VPATAADACRHQRERRHSHHDGHCARRLKNHPPQGVWPGMSGEPTLAFRRQPATTIKDHWLRRDAGSGKSGLAGPMLRRSCCSNTAHPAYQRQPPTQPPSHRCRSLNRSPLATGDGRGTASSGGARHGRQLGRAGGRERAHPWHERGCFEASAGRGYGWGTSGRSMIRSQEPTGWRRSTWTRTPVLSAERVEVSARSSNLTVGSGVSIANFTPASAICW